MRLLLATRVFFEILSNSALAEVMRKHFSGKAPAALPAPETPPAPKQPPAPAPPPKAPPRSDAITLLATLQREARFLDFLMEPLAGYADAQVGAVARDVHRDCGAVVKRLFEPKPAVSQEEGGTVEVSAGFDAGRYRLTGNVTGRPPYRGRLVHPGWEAAKCELPTWTGVKDSARVIAPAEVEL
ncbi:MAG: DUF2760 domain-containing protein [Pirellulales bacterium]|nr:DUF2760 domain-containing protein [Pirellulales bacterium]